MSTTHKSERNHHRYWKHGRVTLLLAIVLCLLSACQLATAQFADPVKVGLLLPLEGEQRELGNSLLPALFAATPATIQGHPVEWVILDTHADPATAAQRARELVADPAVLYVLGPLLYDEVDAVEPIFAEAGMGWTPLVPPHADGIARQTWEPQCWVDQRLKTGDDETEGTTLCYTIVVPDDTSAYQEAFDNAPTPLSWLMWDTTTFMVNQLNQMPTLDRTVIQQAADDYEFPPLESYELK